MLNNYPHGGRGNPTLFFIKKKREKPVDGYWVFLFFHEEEEGKTEGWIMG